MKEKVSIGLPVYNGEKTVATAIDSLLSQDYTNFELIISDNASTDQTEAICRRYAQIDKRVRYFRNASNLGAVYNFNRVFSLATGTYFMWAAHDDIWDPAFIRKCQEQLQDKESIVLCCPDIQFIDEFGREISEYHLSSKNIDTVGMGILDRIRMQIIRQDIGAIAIYGLIRTSFLKQTQLLKEIYGGDVTLVSELLLMGDFVRIPEKLYYRRIQTKPKQKNDYFEVLFGNKELVIQRTETGILKEIINNFPRANMTLRSQEDARNVVIKSLCFENIEWRDLILDEYPNSIGPFFTSALFHTLLEKIISSNLQIANKGEIDFINQCLTHVNDVIGDRKVVIWGAGSSGQRAFCFFKENGYKDRVVGFLDNNPATHGTKFCGLPVFGPQVFKNGHFENAIPFILISSMYANEIENQLNELGFVKNKDYLRRFSILN